MSQALVEKIRRAREQRVTVEVQGAGERDFTVRRPTDAEALGLRGDRVEVFALVCQYTVGWNLTELDVIPGGDAQSVPFSAELFREWAADHPEVWRPIFDAVLDAYSQHRERLGADAKN